MERWIQDEIVAGFQKLACLGLDRTPPAELMPGTVMVWMEAITYNRGFHESADRTRFRTAFTRLMDNRTAWPAPVDFLNALPPREEYAALPSKPADPARAAAAIAEIEKLLRMPK